MFNPGFGVMKLLKPRRSSYPVSGTSSSVSLASSGYDDTALPPPLPSPAAVLTTDVQLSSRSANDRLPELALSSSSDGKVGGTTGNSKILKKDHPPSSFLGVSGWGLVRMKSFRGRRREPREANSASCPAETVEMSKVDIKRDSPPESESNQKEPIPQTTIPVDDRQSGDNSQLRLIDSLHSLPARASDPTTPFSESLEEVVPPTNLEVKLRLPRMPKATLASPKHPLAQALPQPDPRKARRATLQPTPSSVKSSASKRLVKRRPSSIFNDAELSKRDITSQNLPPDPLPVVNQSFKALPVMTKEGGSIYVSTVDQDEDPPFSAYRSRTTSQPSTESTPAWSLNRHPSSSTAASSAVGPSTDESTMLETPQLRVMSGHTGIIEERWHRLDVPYEPFSRDSPHTTQQEDDGTDPYQDSMYETIKQKDSAVPLNLFSLESIPRNSDHALTSSKIEEITKSFEGVQDQTSLHKRSSSPAGSVTTSTVTYTPTVSTVSSARQRKELRISTSALSSPNSVPKSSSPLEHVEGLSPLEGRRRSVTFESQLLAEHTDDTERQSGPRKNRGRQGRPPMIRIRSSSLGGVSLATTSVYSIGEVTTATRTVLTEARLLQLSPERHGDVPNDKAHLRDETTGDHQATEQLYDAEIAYDDWAAVNNPLTSTTNRTLKPSSSKGSISSRQTGASSVPSTRNSRSRPKSMSTRPAPLPPHLSKGKVATSPNQPPKSAPPIATKSPQKSQRESPPTASWDSLQASISKNHGSPSSPQKEAGGLLGTPEPSPKAKRPGMPQRQGSLSRLWRTLSGGGRHKGKVEDDAPQLPVSSNAVLQTTSRVDPWDHRSELEVKEGISRQPSDRVVARGRREKSKSRKSATSAEHGPRTHLPGVTLSSPSAEGTNSHGEISDKKSVGTSSTTEQTSARPTMFPTFTLGPSDSASQALQSPIDFGPTLSSKAVGIPHRSSTLPIAATASWELTLGPFTPPTATVLGDFFPSSSTSTTATLDSSPNGKVSFEVGNERRRDRRLSSGSHDQRRRYRQTLVEIKDDVVFQKVLEDLARLEHTPAIGGGDGERPSTPGGTSRDKKGKRAERSSSPNGKANRQKSTKAWFVIREMVQGERRYGRLLAKGVATVRTVAEDSTSTFPPLPTSSSVSLSPTHRSSSITAEPVYMKESKNKRPKPPINESGNSNQIHHSELGNTASKLTMTSSLEQAFASPLDLLLNRLPPLLAVSLTLSSRFEHDPSPYGVAEAFIAMEIELTSEIGRWASEIGNLVAMGMGELMDRTSMSTGQARRSRSGDDKDDEDSSEVDPDERLGFADIIIMPIQRASRYKLLFQELIATIPPTSQTHNLLNKALKASERLAGECDRQQSFDLSAFKRSTSSPNIVGVLGKKKPRIRPVSVGAGPHQSRSWFSID